MCKVVIFGGTVEGRKLAGYCARHQIKAMVCVVSEYGADLLLDSPWVIVCRKAMEQTEMEELFRREKPNMVLDATHPYASEVTANIQRACKTCHMSYLRVARETWMESRQQEQRSRREYEKAPKEGWPESTQGEQSPQKSYVQISKESQLEIGQIEQSFEPMQMGLKEKQRQKASRKLQTEMMRDEGSEVVWVDSAEEAAKYLSSVKGNILLTTGSRELSDFSGIKNFESRVYARVLPDEAALSVCRSLGLKGSHIIAMQGPFSKEMNLAVIHMTGAKYLVTKESGKAGGFLEKLEAAWETGIITVIIGRPKKPEGICLQEAVKRLEPYGVRCARKIFLVGIGMGGAGQMTGEAVSCIQKAQGISGAKRMLESVSGLISGKEQLISYKPEEIFLWLEQNPQIEEAAVLYSGDIGFYSGAMSLVKLLSRYPEQYHISMIPGVSTVSCLCARLKTGWEDVYLGSLHGRELDVAGLLKQYKRVFLLMGGKNSINEVCRELIKKGYGKIRMSIGMSLSYPEEKIVTGTVEDLENTELEGLCGVLLER